MYQKLFESGTIGSLKLKNRVVMTAAGCEMAGEDGSIPEAYIRYYEERAKGGVGAIITELVQVNGTTGVMNHRQVLMHQDSCIGQLRPLAERMHRYDCRIFLQLQHPGNVTTPDKINGNTPVSASDVSNLIFEQKVRPMELSEIRELEEQFADAAYRAKQAGIDGVEIHAAHFYLLHQFLSPHFNKRTDSYGGKLENRIRILKEIIQKTKEKCGQEYPVIVRVSAEDYLEDGYHLNEGIEICRLLEQYGADAINVTCAGTGCAYGQSLEPVSYEQGWRKHLPEAVKKFVHIPVIGVGVIRDPAYAERLLQDGAMDFVGSARNHLADPEWTKKAWEGREEDICKCISCLKCIQGVAQGTGIGCSVNPRCGHEMEAENIENDGTGRKVIVLGGGPAGMEAAVMAAKRGFSVSLYEKKGLLGGQIHLASCAPHKEKMNWLLEYQSRRLQKCHVDIHLYAEVTLEELKQQNPYAVIDATGAVPIIPGFVNKINGFVYTPDEILDGSVELTGKNVVIAGSGMTGLETAEYLSAKGNNITLLEMDEVIARQAYGTQVRDVMKYLKTRPLVVMTSTALCSIEPGYLTVRDVHTDVTSVLAADAVVLSLGVRNPGTYQDKLQEVCSKYFVIGDAHKSGRIYDAIRAGYQTGLKL